MRAGTPFHNGKSPEWSYHAVRSETTPGEARSYPTLRNRPGTSRQDMLLRPREVRESESGHGRAAGRPFTRHNNKHKQRHPR